MTFVVLPALVVDISAIYDVYFAAFKHNPITRALFPSTTDDDLLNPKSEFRYVSFLPMVPLLKAVLVV